MPSRKATRPDDKRIAANRPRKTAVAVERSRYQMLIDGDLTVADLDDDEIMAGKCKDKGGYFRGRPPAMFPRQLHDAMRQEFTRRTQERINGSFELAIGTLEDIMRSNRAAAPARVRAAEVMLERIMGKVPNEVLATVEVKKFEQDLEGLLIDVGDDNVHTITSLQEKSA